MITVQIPSNITARLIHGLNTAKSSEIGGILMGEQLSPGNFKIVDITLQKHGGYFAKFVREAQDALKALRSFFSNRNFEYERFNYLGEWHSHPSFSTTPSDRDNLSMIEIICDKNTNANFAVLLIVKLISKTDVDGSLTVYLPDKSIHQGVLVIEKN